MINGEKKEIQVLFLSSIGIKANILLYNWHLHYSESQLFQPSDQDFSAGRFDKTEDNNILINKSLEAVSLYKGTLGNKSIGTSIYVVISYADFLVLVSSFDK